MVEILHAHDMQRQVPELFHYPPEFWVVSHQRNDTRAAKVTRLDVEVIDETDQQAPAVAAEADPVLPGAGNRSDHCTSRCRGQGRMLGRLSGPHGGATGAGRSAAAA